MLAGVVELAVTEGRLVACGLAQYAALRDDIVQVGAKLSMDTGSVGGEACARSLDFDVP